GALHVVGDDEVGQRELVRGLTAVTHRPALHGRPGRLCLPVSPEPGGHCPWGPPAAGGLATVRARWSDGHGDHGPRTSPAVRGRTVRTAVWKGPVEGPRMVRRLDIDGDAQGDLAGHGGENRAVFVYQLESYEYWQQQLGRDDFSYGQFGENFTVRGLADDEVCIGDRFTIGEALFEVSQPRVTCY